MFGKLLKKEPDEPVVYAPIKGKLLSLTDVEDPVFSDGILGDGVAIEPLEGKVYAPCNGTITAFFPTGHAVAITSKTGMNILIHIGMDTVKLNGEGFHVKAKQGDKVKKGQILLEFDIDFIKEKGYKITTPVVISNSADYQSIEKKAGDEVDNTDIIIKVI